jgi:hypothetical protein
MYIAATMGSKKATFPRLERFTSKEFSPYALGIGQAALAWNDLHEWLAILFDAVLKTPPHNLSYAIWHSSGNDRACRDMLSAITYEIPLRWLRGFPDAETDVRWLLDRVRSLEDARNDIIHAPLIMFGRGKHRNSRLAAILAGVQKPTARAQTLLGHKRAAKLEDKDLLTEFRRCRDTALVLRNFAAEMTRSLNGARKGWPKRPKLPNRGQKKSSAVKTG